MKNTTIKIISVVLSILLLVCVMSLPAFAGSGEQGDYTGGNEPGNSHVHTGGTATCHSKAICTVCGEEYGEFDPDNHDGGTEIRGASISSCTVPGYTGDTYCLGCGAKLAEGSALPLAEHNVGNWQKDAGYHWHVCSVCEDEVDKAAHIAGDWIIDSPATDDTAGHKHKECTVCGYIMEEDTIPIITEPTHIPGDINNDGEVNNKDLTRLFQYLSEWDVEVNEAALDVNGDGDVNNKDLTRLFQYLSEWDVEIY